MIVAGPDHDAAVKGFAENVLLFHMRPLPIDRKQAGKIAECWYQEQLARRKLTKGSGSSKE
jgi:hypothetical protein